uniref:Uncharacterized protein n=1 Tax=Arundo donax TaxID=35708 RepID=A0A0A9B1V1_ARUDO
MIRDLQNPDPSDVCTDSCIVEFNGKLSTE